MTHVGEELTFGLTGGLCGISGAAPHVTSRSLTSGDATTMIDEHVLEEREKVFLQAQYSDLDLRGMVPQLAERKKQLQGKAGKMKEPTKKPTSKKQEAA